MTQHVVAVRRALKQITGVLITYIGPCVSLGVLLGMAYERSQPSWLTKPRPLWNGMPFDNRFD